MIDIVKHLLELIGKRIWYILTGSLLIIVAFFSFTFNYPIKIQVNSYIQKEEQYQLHNTTYIMRSVVEKTSNH